MSFKQHDIHGEKDFFSPLTIIMGVCSIKGGESFQRLEVEQRQDRPYSDNIAIVKHLGVRRKLWFMRILHALGPDTVWERSSP